MEKEEEEIAAAAVAAAAAAVAAAEAEAAEALSSRRGLRRVKANKLNSLLRGSDGAEGHGWQTMVQCEQFSAMRTPQPFRVEVEPATLFVMDLHAHLSRTEIIGYLGGVWDASARVLRIHQAVPCRATEPEAGSGEGGQRELTVEMDPM
eukprot:UC1_evm1s1315